MDPFRKYSNETTFGQITDTTTSSGRPGISVSHPNGALWPRGCATLKSILLEKKKQKWTKNKNKELTTKT
jgi:hypothetical protein